MDEQMVMTLIQMFKSKDIDNVKLAQSILKNYKFSGKKSAKRKFELEKKIIGLLSLPVVTDNKNLYIYDDPYSIHNWAIEKWYKNDQLE